MPVPAAMELAAKAAARELGLALTRGLRHVRGEMALSVIAYNLKRVINLVGLAALLERLAARPVTPQPG